MTTLKFILNILLVPILVILLYLSLAANLSQWVHHKRPYTVKERQTWFRENGYLEIDNELNYDGKCGKLLHEAEDNALFWNYEKR